VEIKDPDRCTPLPPHTQNKLVLWKVYKANNNTFTSVLCLTFKLLVIISKHNYRTANRLHGSPYLSSLSISQSNFILTKQLLKCMLQTAIKRFPLIKVHDKFGHERGVMIHIFSISDST
jgi:hypothetical protein